jgi:hypothetical protein
MKKRAASVDAPAVKLLRRKRRQSADNGLRPLIRKHLRQGIWWTTIETGLVTQGVPDLNFISDGACEGWVECKATKAWSVKFRPLQIGWHERRRRMGGRTWIAIRRQTTGGARMGDTVDELYLVPGRHAAKLADGGLRECPDVLFMGDGGPEHWRWTDVRRHFLGRII